jgi:hypothetical protein
MLGDRTRRSLEARAKVLEFLALCLRSVDPSPRLVRDVTRRILNAALPARPPGHIRPEISARRDIMTRALSSLLGNCGTYREVVADEIDTVTAEAIQSGDPATAANIIWLATSLPDALLIFVEGHANTESSFWESRTQQLLANHAAAAASAAEVNTYVRRYMLDSDIITFREAIDMPHGLSALAQDSESFFPAIMWRPYLLGTFRALANGPLRDPGIEQLLGEVGQYLCDNPVPPWLYGNLVFEYEAAELLDDDAKAGHGDDARDAPLELSQMAYLGAVAVGFMMIEQRAIGDRYGERVLGSPLGVLPYLERRHHRDGDRAGHDLPDLPVPDVFGHLFRDWAERRVNFTVPDSRGWS